MCGCLRWLMVVCCVWAGLLQPSPARAADVSIAAAADLKFALDDIVAGFQKAHPAVRVAVTFGSSGRFHTQIQQGAPFDLFFSADVAYPRQLAAAGWAGAPVKLYAIGRLALWSNSLDASKFTLETLSGPKVQRIAMANPKHAPYGQRAQEALTALGLWTKIQPKLALGENVGQAVQFVEAGAAQVGIIALSLAIQPKMAKQGGYALVPAHLHQPLEQGYMVTRRGAQRPWPKVFAAYLETQSARQTLAKNGFSLPSPGAPP